MQNIFKVNNRSTRPSPGVFNVNFEYIWHVALECFLLTLNMEMVDGILYCFNLSLSVHSRVGYRNPVICKTKLYITKVNNSFQSLSIFYQKELHLRRCTGLKLNIATWSTKILKGIGGHTSPPWSIAALGKYEKLTLLDAIKIHFQRFFAVT